MNLFAKLSQKKLILFQVLLGMIFLSSGTLKLIDFQGFTSTLMSYGFIPITSVAPFALVIVLIEILIGMSLTLSIWSREGILAAILLMCIFTVFAIYALVFETGWVCQCFGKILATSFSISTVVRNIVLLIFSIYLYFNRPHNYSFDSMSLKSISILISGLVLWCALIFIHSKSEASAAIKEEIRINTKLDDIQSNTIQGTQINTTNRKQPFLMVILFKLTDCSTCLMESFHWEEIYNKYSDSIQVVGIAYAEDGEAELKNWVMKRRLTFPVIFDARREIIDKYNIETPFIILANTNNRVVFMQNRYNSPTERNNLFQKIAIITKTGK